MPLPGPGLIEPGRALLGSPEERKCHDMDSIRIEQRLREAFPDALIEVTSEDNVHFTAKVVDSGFHGQSRVVRHRRAHDAIGPQLGREIHALTLTLRTPQEDSGG